jgi:hypothetical protein
MKGSGEQSFDRLRTVRAGVGSMSRSREDINAALSFVICHLSFRICVE